MAKPPPDGKCVHCLASPVPRNWDHLFPRSWYADTTPENIEKWQIPSCIPCNDKYGRIESDFLSRVGLCLDPHHPASQSIVAKALRSMKPDAGRNQRDTALRAARGMKILRSAEDINDFPIESIVPIGPKRQSLDTQHPILIPATHFELIAAKIVRGIYYLQDGIFIKPTHVIDYFLLHEKDAAEIMALTGGAGKTFAREPCLRIRRAVADDDPMHSIFEIEFWQQLKIYASVELRDAYTARRSSGEKSL